MTRALEMSVDNRTAKLEQALHNLNEANKCFLEISQTDVLNGPHHRRYLSIRIEFASKQERIRPLTDLIIVQNFV